MGEDIDPVEFGKLISDVATATRQLGQIEGKIDKYFETTSKKLEEHDAELGTIKQDSALKKGALIGALGVGSVGGIGLSEGFKKVLEAIGKAFT